YEEAKKGIFSNELLEEIWKDDLQEYPLEELKSLLIHLRLAYESIHHDNNNNRNKKMIVPSLLPSEIPLQVETMLSTTVQPSSLPSLQIYQCRLKSEDLLPLGFSEESICKILSLVSSSFFILLELKKKMK